MMGAVPATWANLGANRQFSRTGLAWSGLAGLLLGFGIATGVWFTL
eukprot:CAMPEP_0205819514 /NCGR_PEP_ID=MMETSP0206-20130828/1933_1 /ASSEMBLY_ACC=CAM_ASM_000279 /TAXON_ID=36767 /ORGANISM="Euplotes focardii, Strain TN1" /LENGTH=45 /DNA_ID= /DNA_START= /DNA_END= /DNA_ORIENTATION=